MPPSDDLPAWLRAGGVPGRRRTDQRRPGAAAALAVLLFLAGGGAGYLVALRRTPAAPPPVPPPVCPPVVACLPPPAGSSGGGGETGTRPRHAKAAHPAPAALVPLPSQKPMEEGERAKALRAFAEKRAPELRDCLDAPDRGPPIELGAAFEINANGSVEVVQILGAELAPPAVRRCYTSHFKSWRFPTELLRGEEKLLVNFVL
ncbi:MAG TPA: hypothetical protein VN853_09220 [Polyangia bacterium]|jgi:hypothetical protein|nr:hypothetical protein [Polyangia bacterium]